MKPKLRRREKVAELILKSAMKLINKEGYDQFSMRKLAEMIDYSPAAIYEYYKSKDNIVRSLGKIVKKKMYNALIDFESSNNIEDLVKISENYIKFAVENPDDFFLFFTRFISERKNENDIIKENSPYLILKKSVDTCLENGCFTKTEDLNSEEISYSIWSLAHGLAMLQTTHLKDYKADFKRVDLIIIKKFINSL